MIETPSIALINVEKETLRMGEKSKESLDSAMMGIMDRSDKDIANAIKKEKIINQLQKTIL